MFRVSAAGVTGVTVFVGGVGVVGHGDDVGDDIGGDDDDSGNVDVGVSGGGD